MLSPTATLAMFEKLAMVVTAPVDTTIARSRP
jgi:hypothetical protein